MRMQYAGVVRISAYEEADLSAQHPARAGKCDMMLFPSGEQSQPSSPAFLSFCLTARCAPDMLPEISRGSQGLLSRPLIQMPALAVMFTSMTALFYSQVCGERPGPEGGAKCDSSSCFRCDDCMRNCSCCSQACG